MTFEKNRKEVIIPCVVSAALILFTGVENLIWQVSSYYPTALASERLVDNEALLTRPVMREICRQGLAEPELIRKENGLFLRCGTPGVEGVYFIRKMK